MKLSDTMEDYPDWEERMRNFDCVFLDLVHPETGDTLPKGLRLHRRAQLSLSAARSFFGPHSHSYWEAIHFFVDHPYVKGEFNDHNAKT
ncbi:MAG: hypothetical protein ISN29_00095 [Gammaproteobacteria bacterium AqS3]|nr:hypothetical protein [Gammaproteobacteria bacterium AqS3]